MFAGAPSPSALCWTNQLLREGVTRHTVPNVAILARLQRHTIDAVLAVSCHVRDTSILVDAEVVTHHAARHKLGLAGGIVRIGSMRTRINSRLFVEVQ
jgi:hypothetical protein